MRRRPARWDREGAPGRRFSLIHIEIAVIGVITIIGLVQSLQSLAHWFMAAFAR